MKPHQVALTFHSAVSEVPYGSPGILPRGESNIPRPKRLTSLQAGTCHQLAHGSPGSRKPTRSCSRKCSPAVLHTVKRCEVLRRYEVNTLPKTSSFSQGMSLSSQTPRLKERFIVWGIPFTHIKTPVRRGSYSSYSKRKDVCHSKTIVKQYRHFGSDSLFLRDSSDQKLCWKHLGFWLLTRQWLSCRYLVVWRGRKDSMWHLRHMSQLMS